MQRSKKRKVQKARHLEQAKLCLEDGKEMSPDLLREQMIQEMSEQIKEFGGNPEDGTFIPSLELDEEKGCVTVKYRWIANISENDNILLDDLIKKE